MSSVVQDIFGFDSSPRSPNVCLLVCVFVCLCVILATTVLKLKTLKVLDFGPLNDFGLDFRLYGLKTLLVYMSQPQGLRHLLLHMKGVLI